MARQIHLPPRTRLIDPSGRAQVHPIGLQRHAPSDLYHWLLTIPWIPLFLVILGFFFVLNALFALAYLAVRRAHLQAQQTSPQTPLSPPHRSHTTSQSPGAKGGPTSSRSL